MFIFDILHLLIYRKSGQDVHIEIYVAVQNNINTIFVLYIFIVTIGNIVSTQLNDMFSEFILLN